MAGDWIKMRAALMQTPEVISMARVLQENRSFRDWLTPGGGAFGNGQLVGDDALRCVTCAALLRVWSAAREHGKFDGDDLILPFIGIPDLDLMAGIPGVGEAMAGVQWALDEECQVRLPNFLKHNVPPQTNAERQAAFRERNTQALQHVTESNARVVTKPLPEKSREEKNTKQRARRVLTPWPEDFTTTEHHATLAAELGLSLPDQLEKCRDHARANDRRQADWNASFTNWLKNAPKFDRPTPAVRQPTTTAAGRTMQSLREAFGK